MSDPEQGGDSGASLDPDSAPTTSPGVPPIPLDDGGALPPTNAGATGATSTTVASAAAAVTDAVFGIGPAPAVPLTKAEMKKRLGQTAIGIAPPALGSKAPPTRPADPNANMIVKAAATQTDAPGAPPPRRRLSAPPPPLPSGRPSPSRPPTKPLAAAGSSPPSAYNETLLAIPAPQLAAPLLEPAGFPPPPEPGFLPPSSREPPTTREPTPRLPHDDTVPMLAQPEPIVPRRRTPPGGIPIAGPTALSPAIPAPILKERVDLPKQPIIRIPQGGMLGSSLPQRDGRGGTLICEILLRNGSVTQEMADKALALQEERGGQIGRILVSLGACTEDAIARALIQQLKARKDEGPFADISAAAREQKDVVGLKVLTRPTRTVITLLLTDLFSLLLAALLATSVHWLRTYSELQTIDWTAWLVVGPSVALCMLTFLGLELYSPMAKSTPDEIRDITFAASLVHLGASLLSTLGDLPIVRWGIFVRGVWWAATLFLVPVIRSIVRNYLSVQPWWGLPVCVLGAAKTGRLIVRTLKAQPRSGLKPVMLLDDDITKHGTLRASFTNEVMDVYSVNVSSAHFLTDAQRAEIASDLFGEDEAEQASQPISSDHIPVAPRVGHPRVEVLGTPSPLPGGRTPRASQPPESRPDGFFGPEDQKLTRAQSTKDASLFTRGKFAEVDGVPLVGDLSLAPVLAHRLKIPYAVLAMPGVDSGKLLHIVERIGGKFTHLLIIPDLFGFATMGVPAKSLGGILGVEVRQQLLLPGPRLAKRCMDVALTALGAIFVLPFLLLIAILIKLDSKGPVFYTQKRLGMNGDHFDAYKFRTMHGDGEGRLKAILDADPALRAEYEIYHKLRKDPRVTRIGRILRKFSLDEFPQLLNVITGDMSLVGPRPYIERELTEMSGQEKIILRAPPGMTGMWQVSDRNATSFAQRVQIDVYYVRNWSPWLDIHILAKTFGVVMRGSGI